MRGRFAPSPTGPLHLGNARTALLAWLQVRAAGGAFVLRVEDLDPDRAHPDLVPAMLADLRWLGLDWDEGPDCGGPHGPYVQTQRTEHYLAALQRLRATGMAYDCFCTRKDVALLAAPHAGEEGPRYPGTCRALTPVQPGRRKRPCVRLRVPDGPVPFVDAIQGDFAIDVQATTGDFVIYRADGVAAYQLAVVVDDAAMGITHVLRGDDLLSSTPRQLLLYAALQWQPPAFAHVPLLLGPDGARLAKRHGAISVGDLRRRGAAPAAVVGYLAWLSGLAPRGAALIPQALIPGFALRRLATAPAVVRPEELPS